MTTMNNEDPAAPSVHEQRELPKPAAWVRDLASPQPHCVTSLWYRSKADADAGTWYAPLYTADQMREAIAAERALLLTDIAALREALDEAATDCELHPLYLGDSATLDDIIRTGGDAAFVTGLARGLREARGSAAEKEQPK